MSERCQTLSSGRFGYEEEEELYLKDARPPGGQQGGGSGGREKQKSKLTYCRHLLCLPGKEPPRQRLNKYYGWDHERQAKPNKALKNPAQGGYRGSKEDGEAERERGQ